MIATFWELLIFFLMSLAIGILLGHLLLLITDDTEKQCTQAYLRGLENQTIYRKTIEEANLTCHATTYYGSSTCQWINITYDGNQNTGYHPR